MRQVAQRLAAQLVAIDRRRWLGLLAAVLAVAAVSVWTDEHGLKARYTSHLDERPVLVRTDDRLSIEPGLASATFQYHHLFSVTWRGWIETDRPGPHRFRVSSSGRTSLAIDGRELFAEGRERKKKRGRVRLEPGLHRLEISFDHKGEAIFFDTEMLEPRGRWSAVPSRRLFDRLPGPLRRLVRGAIGELNVVARNLVGTVLLILALLALRAGAGAGEPGAVWRRFGSWKESLTSWVRDPTHRPWLECGGLALLFAAAGFAIFPRVGSPFGWDDVRYLDIAVWDRNVPWVANRYAHVYLLDLFIWLAGGDPFAGARAFWSVQFGLIVAALAVCVRSLGPKLQTGTFGVALFLLFCQPLFFLRAGASVPDTTVGTLVLVAVALYLNRHAREGPTGFDWQILLIGAITVWAVKSKELGVILLWLVVLFPFERGRLDWRGFWRKLGHWVAGALAGLALLMLFDGVYFGDPFYGLRPSHQAAVGRFNVAPHPQQSREAEGWMEVVTAGKSPVANNNPRMRYMAALIVIAALLASYKRRSIELRLLHLMPVLYLLMLMLLHVRATYVFLARYLYPIVPVSCFLAAAAFHYLGVDELRWRDVRSPRFFVPALLLGFLVFAIVIPYETRWIEARDFLPAVWLESIDWHSLDAFVDLVAAPVLVLTLVLALAFFQSRPMRVLIAATLMLVFLGLPFFRTAWGLRVRRAWQRGELHLHGLRVFEDEIPERPGPWVQVSRPQMEGHRMFGSEKTCDRLVTVYFGRRDLRATCWASIFPSHDVALLSEKDYKRWLGLWPELAETAIVSPGGELVLVRPSEAREPPSFFSE